MADALNAAQNPCVRACEPTRTGPAVRPSGRPPSVPTGGARGGVAEAARKRHGDRLPRLFRLLPDPRSLEMRLFRAHYRALEDEFGRAGSRLERAEYRRVAALYLQRELALRALLTAQLARRTGRGRRPSLRVLSQLHRRATTTDMLYGQGLGQLRERAARKARRGVPTPADLLAAVTRDRDGR